VLAQQFRFRLCAWHWRFPYRRQILFFQDNAVTGAVIHPNYALRAGVFAFVTPMNQSNDDHSVRGSNQRNVRPKPQIFGHCYLDSALVAMPTFMICARCNASISVISFCTGKSRSGRITIAISGFVRLISSNCVLNDSRSTI